MPVSEPETILRLVGLSYKYEPHACKFSCHWLSQCHESLVREAVISTRKLTCSRRALDKWADVVLHEHDASLKGANEVAEGQNLATKVFPDMSDIHSRNRNRHSIWGSDVPSLLGVV